MANTSYLWYCISKKTIESALQDKETQRYDRTNINNRSFLGHAINNKKLLSVHPLTTVKLDIAKRSEHFFQKRDISPNKHYSPHTPSSLEHDDSLRLKLDAYNSTIYLHLQPNHDLFHPNAMFYQDGQETPLRSSDFRVYRGFVVDDRYSDHMWSYGDIHDEMEGEPGVLGWARITVRHDIR
jgi:hypothetical protein